MIAATGGDHRTHRSGPAGPGAGDHGRRALPRGARDLARHAQARARPARRGRPRGAEPGRLHQRHAALDGPVEGGLRPLRPAGRDLGLRSGRHHRAGAPLHARVGPARRRPAGVGAQVPRRERSRSRCPRPAGSPTRWPRRCARGWASTPRRPTPTRACASSASAVERVRDIVDREPASTHEAARALLDKLDARVTDVTAQGSAGSQRRRTDRPAGERRRPCRARPHRAARPTVVPTPTTRRGPARCAPSSRPAARRCATWPRRCVAAVTPAPRFAVPDVAALGPVPDRADGGGRLPGPAGRRRPRPGMAQEAYANALAERDELRGRLEAYAAKAAAGRLTAGATDDLAQLQSRATEVLDAQPADLARAGALLAAYQAYLATGRSPDDDRPRPARSRAAPARSWTATATSAGRRPLRPPASPRRPCPAHPSAPTPAPAPSPAAPAPSSTATATSAGRPERTPLRRRGRLGQDRGHQPPGRRGPDRDDVLARLQPARLDGPRLGACRRGRHQDHPPRRHLLDPAARCPAGRRSDLDPARARPWTPPRRS